MRWFAIYGYNPLHGITSTSHKHTYIYIYSDIYIYLSRIIISYTVNRAGYQGYHDTHIHTQTHTPHTQKERKREREREKGGCSHTYSEYSDTFCNARFLNELIGYSIRRFSDP